MILVTGGLGFVGRHLVGKLLSLGYEPIVTKLLGEQEELLKERIKIVTLDIAKKSDFSKLPRNIEAIFHLAAYIPEKDDISIVQKCLKVNSLGTLNLLEFCRERKVKKIIYSSSVSVYGETAGALISERFPCWPKTYYACSKRLGELWCEKYRKEFGMQSISLRYSSIYGQGQNPNTVLPVFLRNARIGKDIIIYGSGIKVQDFVYVKDVVSANIYALSANVGGVYNIGSGVGTNIVDLAKTISRVFSNGRSKIVFDKNQEEDTSQIYLDISKAERELGFKVEYPLREGLLDYKKELEKRGSIS